MMAKRRIYEIVEVARPGDKASRVFDLFILSLIALNVVALMAETVKPIFQWSPRSFEMFEIISIAVFTVEYLLRIWSCTASERFSFPLMGRLRFALTPLALIDLFAILPFYLPFLGIDLRFLRSVRLARLFRLAKLWRYSQAMRILVRVCGSKRDELAVAVSILGLLLILASSLMYYTESEAQPEAFSSIPAAMWWAIVTLTTVGYGDTYPITPFGKMLGALITVLGIGILALPTAILSAGFVEELRSSTKEAKRCPHCGKEIGNNNW
ncbi:MAG: ion transporter [Candidatus Binatia bacterium]